MKEQEAFNQICAVFARQERPSCSDYHRYVGALRSADGCKCAVGALIPDEQYTEALEGGESFSWVEHVPALADLPPAFLDAVVHAHDDTLLCPTPERIQAGLREVASGRGLDDSAVKKIRVWG